MITGFNTDIRHGDRVFHVQTEDRGLGNPVVESLVYVGGQILLSKKSPYADLVADGKADEKAVRQLMDLQHRRIIEAIRRGRFDGEMPGAPAADTGAARPAAALSPAAAAAAAAILSAPPSGAIPARPSTPAAPPPSGVIPRPVSPPPSGALPRPGAPAGARPPISGALAKPPASGAIPSNSGGAERSLDQVIIEYLASEAATERLELSLMKGGELVSGEHVPISVRAATSLTDRPVAGAHITLRVVSNLGPTQILHRGVTGGDGLVKVTAALPDIGGGHAALIVSATSPLGNQEIKQLIRKRGEAAASQGGT